MSNLVYMRRKMDSALNTVTTITPSLSGLSSVTYTSRSANIVNIANYMLYVDFDIFISAASTPSGNAIINLGNPFGAVCEFADLATAPHVTEVSTNNIAFGGHRVSGYFSKASNDLICTLFTMGNGGSSPALAASVFTSAPANKIVVTSGFLFLDEV